MNLIHNEDCMETMAKMPDDFVDTIITDPPYGLRFMGKKWDYEIPSVKCFEEMLRVCKPGATMLCFGGTRTWHRIAVNIEDAGWEIRDTVMWVYGSGFPKSLNIGKAVDKLQGNEREEVGRYVRPDGSQRTNTTKVKGTSFDSGSNDKDLTKGTSEYEGWGTSLKPAWEPIIVAMKPNDGTYAENALKWGVAGLNIDGGRVEFQDKTDEYHRQSKTQNHGIWDNCKGGLDRNSNPNGRFPANLIHDGSDEVMGLFPNSRSSGIFNAIDHGIKSENWVTNFGGKGTPATMYGDNGSAARFFYCAKASKSERDAGCEGVTISQGNRPNSQDPTGKFPDHDHRIRGGNNHPTVKPLALMEYLFTLTKTPTGGIVYDPFVGSGTTCIAAKRTGRDYIGSEISPEYCEIANRRIGG